jgi:tyrosyl-tRNA synthetase
MTLSEELTWRGFINQTTYKDITILDGEPISFYWGVDPSADSMTIGNLAAAMMVKAFIKNKHKGFLLLGGATGMIGDPDGKADERVLKSPEEIDNNKQPLAAQYRTIFEGLAFDIVDNYDWFRDMHYLDFLRDVGKHVPMRQMLARDFVQSRLGEDSSGISYAEFSYVLIQGYDFLHLYREHGVSLQVAGIDQWGNSIAGVELIRRITGQEAHVWTTPLIVNKATGKKFGKTESGAIWLDPKKTTPTQFYQFWVNIDDEGVEDYLKVYTELDKPTIDALIAAHQADTQQRRAQIRLAQEVTRLIHGEAALQFAELVTGFLVGSSVIGSADEAALNEIRQNIPAVHSSENGSIVMTMVAAGLASSNSDARRLVSNNAVSVNGQKINKERFDSSDFQNGRLLLRRGKAYKDSALVELGDV